MVVTELRTSATFLEEDGHHLEGILCQRLLKAKRLRRKQQDVEA